MELALDTLELMVLVSNEPLLLLDALDLSALLLCAAGVAEPRELPTSKKEQRELRPLLLGCDSDSDIEREGSVASPAL